MADAPSVGHAIHSVESDHAPTLSALLLPGSGRRAVGTGSAVRRSERDANPSQETQGMRLWRLILLSLLILGGVAAGLNT